MIEVYCDGCGAPVKSKYEGDIMVYFRLYDDGYSALTYHLCPTCSVNMRGELQNMIEYAEKAKRGKHGKS